VYLFVHDKTSDPEEGKKKTLANDDDSQLTFLGPFFINVVSKHYINQESLSEHQKGKIHKKRYGRPFIYFSFATAVKSSGEKIFLRSSGNGPDQDSQYRAGTTCFKTGSNKSTHHPYCTFFFLLSFIDASC
jgi:hypothetical protein